MRKKRGFFEQYEGSLDLVGIISCAGCPTLAAPEKILKRIKALAEYRLDALHFSFCVVALCPFISAYEEVIAKAYPSLEIIRGTHTPRDKKDFQAEMKELLCQTIQNPQDMTDLIRGNFKKP
jgi:predicted metal-binding protein